MTDKPYYTTHDIMDMQDVGLSVAQRIMREAKNYADVLGVKGRIAKTDYDAWCVHTSKVKAEESRGNELAFAMASGLINLLTRSQIEELLMVRGLSLAKERY